MAKLLKMIWRYPTRECKNASKKKFFLRKLIVHQEKRNRSKEVMNESSYDEYGEVVQPAQAFSLRQIKMEK